MPIDSLTIALIPIFFIGIVLFIVLLSYKKVEDGKALFISGARGYRVTFSGSLVIPILEKYETLNITVKPIIVNLTDNSGLLTKDNHIIDVKADFYIRVNPEQRDVIMVAQSVGVEKASSQEFLEELFVPKFSEALRTVGSYFDFEDFKSHLAEFKNEVLQIIGMNLNGFVLDDVSINYIPSTVRKLNLE